MKKGFVGRIVLMGVLASLVAICLATGAMAAGQISAGPLKLRGELIADWVHRSNIYLSENNTVSDNIYEIKPALALRHDLSPTSFYSLSYQGIFATYADNSENNWNSHTGVFDSNFGGAQGPYVALRDVYINTEDPFGSPELYRQGEKTKRQINIFRVAPGYRFGELARAEVFYENLFTKYDLDRDKTQNQNENRYGATYYHKVMAKTSVLAQYRYVTRKYPDQVANFAEDFKRNDFYVGLAWDATSKLNGELKVGYSSQDYDNTFNPQGNEFQKKDDFAAEANLTYQASPNLLLLLAGERAIKESTFINSNYYIDTNVTLGAKYQIVTNLQLFASGTLGKNKYNNLASTTARDDDVFKAEIGAEYSFLRYFFVHGGYRLDKKNSNLTNMSYTDDIFFAGVGGRF